MPTITKTNQIASTRTKSDSKNQSKGPKNAVLDSKLDPFTKQHRVNRIYLKNTFTWFTNLIASYIEQMQYH